MVLGRLAYCISLNGNPAKALALTYQGLQIADANNFRRAQATLYNNMANIYYTINDDPKSLLYRKKHLAIAELLKDDNLIATVKLLIGTIFMKTDPTRLANYYSAAGYNYKVKHFGQLTYNDCIQ